MPELTSALVTTHIVILREADFSFRHDLMRAYLATCWVMKEAPDWCQTLEEDAVWKLSNSDQHQLFVFVAELVDSPELLNAIAQFAVADLDT